MLPKFNGVRGLALVLIAGLCADAQALSLTRSYAPVIEETPAALQSPVPCVRGFSKDACAGDFGGGSGVRTDCPISSVPCETLTVTGQKWTFDLRANQETCTATTPVEIRCDEVKDGRFEAKVDYVLRLNDPCKYRGCLSGEGVFYSDSGAVFAGRIHGTMGVGTDRKPRCPVVFPPQPPILPNGCERCWDVELQTGSLTQMWRVGVDASFCGVRIDADTGEELCLTISGDFYARGDGHGIFDLVNGWKYYGNADGVYTFLCGGIGTP